jgi:hypothetical protein
MLKIGIGKERDARPINRSLGNLDQGHDSDCPQRNGCCNSRVACGCMSASISSVSVFAMDRAGMCDRYTASMSH